MQKEKLSALMDGETLDNELLNELSRSSEMQKTWESYHLIRDTLRGDTAEVLQFDISARVMAAIENEPVRQTAPLIPESQPAPHQWRQMPFWNKVRPWASSLTQMGVAACVSLGKLDYTIADSVAVSLFQRVHPELAVALDITDEQPVTWFSARDDDNSLSAAMLDFFNNINEDGTLARLEEKYLGHGNDFDYVDTRTFLRAVENILPEVQPLFEKYAREIDWRLLAAIAWQESHWDPQATSPTGVRGMMMLTRNTAQSLGLTDRTDAAQSIDGGMRYLQDMMDKVPDSIPKDERIWFALAAYNMGYAHMLDAMALTRKQKGNPNSWADVKLRLPLLSQKPYYSKLKYGYARGHEAYAYVENIRKYQISLVGYLSEKERQQQQTLALAEDYPAVLPNELEQPQETTLPFFKFRADKQMDNARMKLPGHLY